MHADMSTARASDVMALVALENAVFPGDRISGRSFRAFIASKSAAVLVRRNEQALAGYAVVLFRKGSSSARLYSIAVDPQFSGIGRLLLAAAEAEARRRGSDELRLEVREDNDRAIRLYEQSGYVRRSRAPAYYADGAAALKLTKSLDAAVGTVAA